MANSRPVIVDRLALKFKLTHFLVNLAQKLALFMLGGQAAKITGYWGREKCVLFLVDCF